MVVYLYLPAREKYSQPFNSRDSTTAAYHFERPKDTGWADLILKGLDFGPPLRELG
jgi:hypothetical protein